MSFEYIRAIVPPPQDDESARALEPVPPGPRPTEDGAPALDQLVAKAHDEAGVDPTANLATPAPLRFALPSFVSVSLTCAPLELDEVPPAPSAELGALAPSRWAAWQGPSMVAMTLAVAATMAFGAFVVVR